MAALSSPSTRKAKISRLSKGVGQGPDSPGLSAFVDHDGQQCGYCTPGFVMAAKAFLDRNPNPTNGA